jgi:hypothetical protein
MGSTRPSHHVEVTTLREGDMRRRMKNMWTNYYNLTGGASEWKILLLEKERIKEELKSSCEERDPVRTLTTKSLSYSTAPR